MIDNKRRRLIQILSSSVGWYLIARSGSCGSAAAAEEPLISTPGKTADSKEKGFDYKTLSNAEWKKRLSPEQYKVAREHGTERAYSGKYHDLKKDGAFQCVCCGQVVFDSKEKFDSKTGWPSFWQPIEASAVGESEDNLLETPRTEVHCSNCDAHLGHVFNDAPQTPTGLRYCINSICLIFVPREVKAPQSKKN